MVNRKEERNTVEVSFLIRPVNFLERAYRQLTMTGSGYPMKIVFFFNLRQEKLDLWIHSSRKVRAHVSKCAFVGGLLSCQPACQTDMDMRLPRTFVDKRTYVFGRATSFMAFTLSLAWFTSICLA